MNAALSNEPRGRTPAPSLLLSLLLPALLLLALWDARPVQAQETTALKAAHQGAFLPEGTRVVVLGRRASVVRDGRVQPEFVARGAFPRDPELLLRRDRMDERRQTRVRYPKSQDAARVYFLYALTPDGTLYWSYSARQDSLKFDVVDRGVMSVAPVHDAAVREAVLSAYFGPERPQTAERAVVYMPGEREGAVPPRLDSLLTAAADTAAVTAAADPAAPDSSLAGFSAEVDTNRAVPPEAAEASAAAAPVHGEGSSDGSPVRAGVLYGLLVLALGAAGVAAWLAWHWRRELDRIRRERLGQWAGTSPDEAISDPAPEAALQRAAEAEQAREQLEQDYAVLRVRYNALRRELDALRAEERTGPV